MTTWRIEFANVRLVKQLDKLPVADRKAIIVVLKELKHFPEVKQLRKLSGIETTYRLRVGNYRVVFETDQQKLHIVVLLIKHRRDVYEVLKRMKR